MTTDRASPKDAGEGPVHCAGAGDGVVVGEDRDVTTDRARPKDAGEGPVHWRGIPEMVSSSWVKTETWRRTEPTGKTKAMGRPTGRKPVTGD